MKLKELILTPDEQKIVLTALNLYAKIAEAKRREQRRGGVYTVHHYADLKHREMLALGLINSIEGRIA